MNHIIGLESIKKNVENYTLDTLPHSIIILGKQGSGKHVIVNLICEKFNFELIDITKDLSEELVENIYRYPNIRSYMIDLRLITEKNQNIILKLFEEPPVNAFIFILANNSNQVLPTVLNRGLTIYIPRYDYNDLIVFAKSKNINLQDRYKHIIETPGDILSLYSNNTNLDKLEELIDKISSKLNIASYSNTLTIANKLNYSDEYDKFDIKLFLDLLCLKYSDNYLIKNISKDSKLYNIVNGYKKKLDLDPRLNKKNLITNMLGELWRVENADKLK